MIISPRNLCMKNLSHNVIMTLFSADSLSAPFSGRHQEYILFWVVRFYEVSLEILIYKVRQMGSLADKLKQRMNEFKC